MKNLPSIGAMVLLLSLSSYGVVNAETSACHAMASTATRVTTARQWYDDLIVSRHIRSSLLAMSNADIRHLATNKQRMSRISDAVRGTLTGGGELKTLTYDQLAVHRQDVTYIFDLKFPHATLREFLDVDSKCKFSGFGFNSADASHRKMQIQQF